jgi:hypothetical protein
MINKDADRLIRKLIEVQTRYPLPKFSSIYKEYKSRRLLSKIGDFLCPANK